MPHPRDISEYIPWGAPANDALLCLWALDGKTPVAIEFEEERWIVGSNINNGRSRFEGLPIGYSLSYCDDEMNRIAACNYMGTIVPPGWSTAIPLMKLCATKK